MPYLRAMRGVADLAFISAQTRAECAARILRRPPQRPGIPMGADGLGLARQAFDPARADFVMLGSIEPRKNPAPVMPRLPPALGRGVRRAPGHGRRP